MKTTDPPVIVENTIDADCQTVWNAITIHDEMVKWYFEENPAFEAKVGFETQFVIEVEDRKFTHCWKVTKVDPAKLIAYSWHYPEYPGAAVVTFNLIPKTDSQTTVRVTVDVTEDFPDHIPEFKRDSCVAGWEYFLKEQLAGYLKT